MSKLHDDFNWKVWGNKPQSNSSASSSIPYPGSSQNASQNANKNSSSQATAEPVEVEPAPTPAAQDDSCYAKVKINSVELLPGPSGEFEFNAKCKAKASIKILNQAAEKKSDFTLICLYKTQGEAQEKEFVLTSQQGNDSSEIATAELFSIDPTNTLMKVQKILLLPANILYA